MKIAGICLAAIVLSLALTWVFEGNDFFLYKYFAPRREQVLRQVFEQSPSYIQGKVEYLTRLRFQYGSAEGSQKTAMKQLILDEASTVDNSKLPGDLQVFINSLKDQI